MSKNPGKLIAWVVVVLGIVLEFPVQQGIDVYRNTFRVILYSDARDQDIANTEQALKNVGLSTKRVNVKDKLGKPSVMLTALVPRKEWGGAYEKYITAVHNLPRIDHVIPGINEQGIPLDQVQQLNVQDAGIIVMAALIGGFRKSAANVLWLQNEENWHAGKSYKTVPLARAVTLLDPYFVDAWVLTCWHLSYNMSVEAKTPDEAAELIRAGLDFAEKGVPWNSTRYEIYQEIGWTYYDKLQNYEQAAEWLKRSIEHPHPTFLERMIAHSYERLPEIDQALKWYDVSLRKYGAADSIATGAIATITERYLNAWRFFKAGDFDRAGQQLEADWAAAKRRASSPPSDTIYLHFKARICEARAAKAADQQAREALYREAFTIWLQAGKTNATDRLARRRVLTLAENFNWKQDVPSGWNDVGLPDKWADALNPGHKGAKPATGAEQQPGQSGAGQPGAGQPGAAPPNQPQPEMRPAPPPSPRPAPPAGKS